MTQRDMHYAILGLCERVRAIEEQLRAKQKPKKKKKKKPPVKY